MRKILLHFALLWICFAASAQSPQGINYQTVIRDNQGNPLINALAEIEITIISGSVTGDPVYIETHGEMTNAFGLVNLVIGTGTPQYGTFGEISWKRAPHYLQTAVDLSGNGTYQVVGVTQFLSVPYAFHASTADNLTQSFSEVDPVFTSSPAQGISQVEIDQWNTTYQWGNHAVAGYVPGFRTLTINGNQQDISADRTWFVGTVTSLLTNNGITGGPITSFGTIGLSGQALAFHNLSSNGLTARTGFGAVAARTIQPSDGIAVTNGNGVDGNPTIGLTGQALALHNLTNWGLLTRTSSGSITTRIIAAGTGITVTNNNGTSGNPTVSVKTYQVGEFAFGGVVFWVDETGQHGLVCAVNDLNGGNSTKWCGGTTNWKTNASGDKIHAGYMNTTAIISVYAARGDNDNHAALYAANYYVGDYGDWYLPSKHELNLMYQNKSTINATATANGGSSFQPEYYWSSTEEAGSVAWAQNFQTGLQDYGPKITYFKARAIRHF